MSVQADPETGKVNQKYVWERQIRNACPHQLPSGARLAAYTLATHMNPNGLCFVGAARLAKGMGKSIRTAKRAKTDLIRLGWVELTNEGDREADGGFMASSLFARLPVLPPCQQCREGQEPSVTDDPTSCRPGPQVGSPVTLGSDASDPTLVTPVTLGRVVGGPITDPHQISRNVSDQKQTKNKSRTDTRSAASWRSPSPPISGHHQKMKAKGVVTLRRGIEAAKWGQLKHPGTSPRQTTEGAGQTTEVSSQDKKRKVNLDLIPKDIPIYNPTSSGQNGKALASKVRPEYTPTGTPTSSGPDQKGLPARDMKMPRKKSRSRFPEMSEEEKAELERVTLARMRADKERARQNLSARL